MINIIKDIFNLKNWFLFLKNPNYVRKKLIIRFLSYPSKRVGNISNKTLRNMSIDFWIYFAKKNKSFQKFFFSDSDKNKIESYENYKNNYTYIKSKTIESLEHNGIAIFENILSKEEHLLIKENFKKLINENNNYNWLESPKDISKSDQVNLIWDLDDINKYQTLKKINDDITKIVFGKICNANIEYFMHKSKSIPENIINGDNHLHMDRFLPNLKLYYSPFKIEKNDAPFNFVKGSHKINEDYLSYWKNSNTWDEYEDLKKNNTYLKSKIQNIDYTTTLEENSLIAAFTNGLHGRSPFLKKSLRQTIFICYNSFNKLSLLNPKYY